MTANFFEVDVRTISRYLEQNADELSVNGYEVLRGKNLKSFLDAAKNSGKDINVPTKTTVLGVFDFRAFLNFAMLLSESDKARAMRQLMLDIVIDIINRKTGDGTKYINQRDKDFVFSSLQEDNYRRQFTLMEYLGNYQNQFLYQKTGYLLSYFPHLKLSAAFFDFCAGSKGNSSRYLYNDLKQEHSIFGSSERVS